jgi:hypothetical protein
MWPEILRDGQAHSFAAESWLGTLGIQAQDFSDNSLQAFYSAHVSQSDCRETVASNADLPLLLWIDGKHHRLVIGANLLHVYAACTEHIVLNTRDARRLGFSDKFLQSLGE